VLAAYYSFDWAAYGPPQWESVAGWTMGLNAELASLPPTEAAARIQADPVARAHCFAHVIGFHSQWFADGPPVWARLGRWLERRAAQSDGRPLRLWSAGCGTGQEAYALGLLLLQRDLPGQVRATSIDPTEIQSARRGVYRGAGQPHGWPFAADSIAGYFTPSAKSSAAPSVRVGAELRRRVRFRAEDLLRLPARATPRFDLIVCRGVLGYLRRDAAARVVAALAARLRPGGRLWAMWAYWPAICETPPVDHAWPALRELPAEVPLRPLPEPGCWVRLPRGPAPRSRGSQRSRSRGS
jgi:chemotaxis methyl-accepting protein methylase